MRLVLLHSPLVGPGTWDVLAPGLRGRGHDVVVADFSGAMQGGAPFYPKLVAVAVAGLKGGDGEQILVVHSGAGALVPAIAAAAKVRGAIFIDALLPHPGRCWFETAPDGLKAHLRNLARDGNLPPWHRWWPKGAIEILLPDPAMYARFVGALHELPLAYFEERAPDAKLETPSAYLQLSAACKAEADRAERDDWPVTRLELHHLAMLTHPDTVADGIESLAAGL